MAEHLSIGETTVKSYAALFTETGDVLTQSELSGARRKGRYASMPEEHLGALKELIEGGAWLYLDEYEDELADLGYFSGPTWACTEPRSGATERPRRGRRRAARRALQDGGR